MFYLFLKVIIIAPPPYAARNKILKSKHTFGKRMFAAPYEKIVPKND
tara:strand:- start:3082 stop:3222 length:141 start_codon:yes stop_codon:yes gene_type:complete